MGNFVKNFQTPVYADTWRYNFEFAKYARRDIFWINLDYYIARDCFKSRVSRSNPLALDFAIKSVEGEQIFRGKDVSTLQPLGYILINEDVSISNADEDILKVTETYGYAPNELFTIYTTEVWPRPGVEDTSGYLKQSITQKSGLCTWDSANQTFTLDLGTDIADKFAAGDSIRLFGQKRNSTEYDIQCPNVVISEISKGLLKMPAFTGVFLDSNYTLSQQNIYWFLNGTLYVEGAKVWRNCSLIRDYTKRAAANVITSTRNEISYSNTFPALEHRFVVTDANGSERDTINTQTIPTLPEWKAKVAAGQEIVITDAEVENIHTLYKKTVKYAKCR